MTRKQLIFLLGGLFGFFIISILAIWGIVKIDPTLIGLPPLNLAKDPKPKDYYEPKIKISAADMDKYQKEMLKTAAIKDEKNYLAKQNKFLADSIMNFGKSLSAKDHDLKKIQDSIQRVFAQKSQLSDSLSYYQGLYKNTAGKLREIETMFADKELVKRKSDSINFINYKEFAKIYDNSSPAEVAKILEKVDKQDAAKILKLMQKKKAGKVIEVMNPERGAAILLIGKEVQN